MRLHRRFGQYSPHRPGNTEDTCHGCAAHICDACRAAIVQEAVAAVEACEAREALLIVKALERLPHGWEIVRRGIETRWWVLGQHGLTRAVAPTLPDLARAVLERFGREEEAR